ncbi:MAG: hypothetical protein HQL96_12900 [Magnetococcales bacterium]|nr:hypothetical protein [Magnetococcales bacterium]
MALTPMAKSTFMDDPLYQDAGEKIKVSEEKKAIPKRSSLCRGVSSHSVREVFIQ